MRKLLPWIVIAVLGCSTGTEASNERTTTVASAAAVALGPLTPLGPTEIPSVPPPAQPLNAACQLDWCQDVVDTTTNLCRVSTSPSAGYCYLDPTPQTATISVGRFSSAPFKTVDAYGFRHSGDPNTACNVNAAEPSGACQRV